MAFSKATASVGLQIKEVLSADNMIPERHIIIETLRSAAPRIGLTSSVISTLDAMLSCLAPNRNHHTVFASNATLTFRRNGISDRTIRRHAAKLQELGLLTRNDSPNGKRYTKHSRTNGKALRFGFDLTPLFKRLQEIFALAEEVQTERQEIEYLRCKIRAAANAILKNDPTNQIAQQTICILRRKLTLKDCEDILASLPNSAIQAEGQGEQFEPETTNMSAKDGQNVRHHHNSNKELIDKKDPNQKKETPPPEHEPSITVPELLAACPVAAEFSLGKINTVQDVISHARTLAPMIGISKSCYEAAHERLGSLRAAATVWAIMQFHERIKSVGAYFRSITTGIKSKGFSPERLVRRLALEIVPVT